MRSPKDARDEGATRSRAKKTATAARKRPKGGKALLRLLTYFARREPVLIQELAPREKPSPAQVPVGPAREMVRATRAAPATRGARAAKAAPTPRASKSFASAMGRAAAKVTARQSRSKTRTRAKTTARARAVPAGPAPTPSATTWIELGPLHIPNGQTYGTNRVDVSGRVSCVAVDPRDPRHLLCGSANGGIWESHDTGATWAPRTDQMPSLAIGAITFDPHDAKRVYAGSGEGNSYANLGAGVYRSTDGGTTWSVLTAAPFVGVGFFDLAVDPVDKNRLYAATTEGFFVSSNGGGNWSRRRKVICWDLTVHPSGGATEILATFEDGLFVSTNAGGTFTAVALPSKPAVTAWARLSVDRVQSTPDVAYVFGAAGKTAHLWRRSGTTWTKITTLPSPPIDTNQAWYDWYVAASPKDPSQVFLGAIDGFRGALSGSTWTWKNFITQGSHSIHPDQHGLTFSPDNPRIIYACNDGGLFRSPDSGATWKALNKGLAITEVEYLGSDPTTSTWLMAGTQDNGTIRYVGAPKWDHIADGDGGDCGVNQLNPKEVYHSYYEVSLERSANKGNTWTDLNPPSVPSLFYPPVEVAGKTVAIGAALLVITRSGGPPWTKVPLGLGSNDAASAMRAVDANTFLIGSTKGRMLRAAWNGTSWTVSTLTSPAARFISGIAIDPSNPLRIWVTFSQLGGGRVFRSDDAGVTWTDCTAGLPAIPMNAVVVDPANYKRVWVAADVGVYESTNLGTTWSTFSTGLPNAMAADLVFHKQDRILFCGTRNRGVWAISVP